MTSIRTSKVKIRNGRQCELCYTRFDIGANLNVDVITDGWFLNNFYYCDTCKEICDDYNDDGWVTDGEGSVKEWMNEVGVATPEELLLKLKK